jgi:alpha-mannosidase
MNALVETAFALLERPRFLAHLVKARKHIYKTVFSLNAEFCPSREPVDFQNRSSLEFTPVKRGQKWADMFGCAWFRFTGGEGIAVPDGAVAIIDVGGEGCVYDENGAVQGLTNVLSVADVFQSVAGKKVVECSRLKRTPQGGFDIWVDAGYNGFLGKDIGSARFKRADIAEFRKDVLDYAYDFCALHQYACVSSDEKEVKAIVKDLGKAARLVGGFSRENVQAARRLLAKYYANDNSNPFEITAVGHAHLDLAWLWPMRETKRKAVRTYTNALVNLEKFPDYIFGSSQPQQFEWMKKNRPEVFKRIAEQIKAGRIEPQGLMWCEPDTNIPCGESLIRQCYFGKRFFREEFGVESDYLWVPDVFGYSASLPRILRGCGADKFMTIKLSWNTVNKFPYHSFVWKGIGDGEVLVHMPPEGDYNSSAFPFCTKRIEREYRERKVSDVALMPFGAGDGGGGPGEFHLNIIDRQSRMSVKDLPRIKFGSAAEFFKKLEAERARLPRWEGELYLEKHQGTYTTQGRMKRDMRRAEVLLHNTEFICTAAALKGFEYPYGELAEIWKTVLLHQFHDILPGSSIKRVYDEAKLTFEALTKKLEAICSSAEKFLATETANVINATSFARKGYIKCGNEWYCYDAQPYASSVLCAADNDLSVKSDAASIENGLVKVKFNDRGEIVALTDKQSGENAVARTFNTMRVYTDKNMVPYGAWDIDINYMNKPSSRMRLVSSQTYTDGVRAVREQVLKYGKSVLKQRIFVYADNPCVYVENEIDWQENLKMLRADFYPARYSDKVACDIQFGHIERSTQTKSKTDWAQFEICAHKWVELNDGEGGFALLNDCKYGHRVKDGLVSLNLLRSPVYPDKTADRGKHSFAYAMYAYKGGTDEGKTDFYAYALNNAVVKSACGIDSLAQTDNAQVVIETICTTKEGRIALRAYEREGKACAASFTVGFGFKKAELTNLLFENGKECSLKNVEFSAFEIKTFVLEPETTIVTV